MAMKKDGWGRHRPNIGRRNAAPLRCPEAIETSEFPQIPREFFHPAGIAELVEPEIPCFHGVALQIRGFGPYPSPDFLRFIPQGREFVSIADNIEQVGIPTSFPIKGFPPCQMDMVGPLTCGAVDVKSHPGQSAPVGRTLK